MAAGPHGDVDVRVRPGVWRIMSHRGGAALSSCISTHADTECTTRRLTNITRSTGRTLPFPFPPVLAPMFRAAHSFPQPLPGPDRASPPQGCGKEVYRAKLSKIFEGKTFGQVARQGTVPCSPTCPRSGLPCPWRRPFPPPPPQPCARLIPGLGPG